MEFEFQYTMCAEDCIALNKMRNQMLYRRRNKVLQAVYSALGVLLLGLGLTTVQQGSVGSGIFMTAVGVFFLIHIYTLGRLSRRRAERIAAESAREQTVSLEENGIRVKDSTAEGFVAYSDFSQLWHMEGYYCLLFGETHTLLLPEKAVTVGEPEALRGFLEEKLERETAEL